MTYYSNAPSVNLDHCNRVSRIACSDTGRAVSFWTTDAYVQARVKLKGLVDS